MRSSPIDGVDERGGNQRQAEQDEPRHEIGGDDVVAVDEQVDELPPDEEFRAGQEGADDGERKRQPDLPGRRRAHEPNSKTNGSDSAAPTGWLWVGLGARQCHVQRMSHKAPS